MATTPLQSRSDVLQFAASHAIGEHHAARIYSHRLTLGNMAKKVKRPNCVNNRKCGRQAKGPYARFCTPCFVANAKLKGSDSSGNANARCNLGNAGNVKKGKVKKNAGKRSGLRRSAKRALVVKKKWLDLIFAGRKTWEIRGSSTSNAVGFTSQRARQVAS